MPHFKQFAFKKFGYFDFSNDLPDKQLNQDFKEYIKVIFVRAGGKVVIDFKEFQLETDALFFISGSQHYWLDEVCCGTLLYYNRDFYCVEIHDKEVSCDGILFHNVYEIPVVPLDAEQSAAIQKLLRDIEVEIASEDSTTEEMLRILLKQIIIKATRLWKQEHQIRDEEARQEVEFSRKFSQLVEWNYTQLHTVADYAEMLHITPKALNKRITRYSNTTPNDIIKNRIILEAKRLLAHTTLSVKEIGYRLGYEDTSYFIRLFTNQTELSPQSFRSQYVGHQNATFS
ncbi:AraC family transcriptional regulator [Telluribacter sp. SYSU D00476]|uniref:helix-turn-helix domain-containing protein n=1 Tax=Telluribacter sp. SYSU D00476 TaxID=2811430 RepID=UPI001FF31B89|nr:helix-turn-helix transcriptional regulator [Telluribacter sp. SYSU D00476]